MKFNIILSFFILLFSFSATAQDKFRVENILNEGKNGSERDMLTINQDPRIDTLVNRHILRNEKGVEGWRILIWRGGNRDAKDEAPRIKQGFMNDFPDIPSEVTFDQPNWFKVKVGYFRSREEAAPVFFKILQKYPNAYLVRDKIILKTSTK
jgi:hypothetical protein